MTAGPVPRGKHARTKRVLQTPAWLGRATLLAPVRSIWTEIAATIDDKDCIGRIARLELYHNGTRKPVPGPV